jgi:hypothetical protein
MADNYRIMVTGVAAVGDLDRQPITDPETLRALDGIEYGGDEFTEYLGGPDKQSLVEALNPSGDIALKYDESKNLLLYVTEYSAKRKLNRAELDRLLKYTTGQWSDGIGSGFNTFCWDNYDTWMDYRPWNT